MRRSSRVSTAVRQRLETLDRGLAVSLDLDAEALHRARVATRRLREALPLVTATGDGEALTGFRHAVRDATRALGGVREIDVALLLVEELAATHPQLAPALDTVRCAMAGERVARLERMQRRLDTGGLQLASRALAERLRGINDRPPIELLAERVRERVEGLRDGVDHAGLLYAAERLHRVRVATKKLRYVLELVGDMGVASTKRLVADLKRLQECLGRLHDLEAVAYVARQALESPRPGTPAARVLPLLEEQIRTQHAEYLSLHKRVAVVLDRATALGVRLERAARETRHRGPK